MLERMDASALKDTIIFLSNSPIDGKREGDGDLIDKLTSQFQSLAVTAIRIVKYLSDEFDLKETIGINTLSGGEHLPFEQLNLHQKKLFHYIINSPYKNKILYIGSRINHIALNVEKNKIEMQHGSGPFYNTEFLEVLRAHKIKIVICCLELKFFTRGFSESFFLYEMLKNHLRHADAIHFLTAGDKEFFETELMESIHSERHLLDAHIPFQSVHQAMQTKKMSKGIKKIIGANSQATFMLLFSEKIENYQAYISNFNQEKDTILKSLNAANLIYARGICTTNSFKHLTISEAYLMQREKNIMVFGLLRGNKGVIEGIELGKLLHQQQSQSKVYIIGKAINCSQLIHKLLRGIYDIDSAKEKGFNLKKMVSTAYKIKEIELMNQYFQEIFVTLDANNVKKIANVECIFNVSESELIPYINKCRYALKLDIKGFAENASAMVSTMIGMALPTITQRGMLTPKSTEDFGAGLCLLDDGLESRNGIVRPCVPDLNKILEILNEPEEIYRSRVHAILNLRCKEIYTAKELTFNLLTKIFIPLTQPSSSLYKTSNAFFPIKTPAITLIKADDTFTPVAINTP
jgi:hypothetical protein